MSSSVPRPFSYARIASRRYGTSRRFTMKPGLSGAVIGSLPSDCAKSKTCWYVSSLVVSARITSTSFISGTGLKKCRPANRSGRFVLAASSVMHRDEVFEQKIVRSATMLSRTANAFAFSSTFSTMASIIRSQAFRSSSFVVPDRFPSVVCLASAVTLPLSTPSLRNFSIRPMPFFRNGSSTSRTIVLYPDAAQTCAIPDPINPQPSTPTVVICIAAPCPFTRRSRRTRRYRRKITKQTKTYKEKDKQLLNLLRPSFDSFDSFELNRFHNRRDSLSPTDARGRVAALQPASTELERQRE